MRNQPLPYRARIRQDKNGYWHGQLVTVIPFVGERFNVSLVKNDKAEVLAQLRATYAADCQLYDDWEDVDLWKPADQFDRWTPRTGAFDIYWESGESSVAIIYQDKQGDYWLAPTNWTEPGKLADHWDEISGLAEIIRP